MNELTEPDIARYRDDVRSLCAALDGAVVGQQTVVADLVTAVLAGGHVLLEGLPGLGKTSLTRALANALGLDLARIQCTPDLMPGDITGSEVLAGEANARLEFRPGPIFASMVLVDEINRATPKTQSALLEAMQEGRVTYGGTRHPLPAPFWVLATQNPIEIEGTYPLPEAQLDRFAFKLEVGFPSSDALTMLVERTLDAEPADQVGALFGPGRLEQLMTAPRQVVVSDAARRRAVTLVLATHPHGEGASEPARRHFRYGASPRALQAMLRAARVRALAAGRAHVSLDDVRASALPVLRHRVLLRMESELDGTDPDRVLGQIVDECCAHPPETPS